MTQIDILMPALSPTMEQGTLARWRVRPGEAFAVGDVLAEIESDKATMEIEAEASGVLAEILVGDGAEGVPVDTPIGRFTSAATPAVAPPPPPRAIAPSLPAAEIIVTIAADAASQTEVRQPATQASHAAPRAAITPLAQLLASQRGIDLGDISGSGPQGRIVLADVAPPRAGVTAPASTEAAVAVAPQAALRAIRVEPREAIGGSYELRPLDGLQRTVARRMTETFRDVPHFPLTIDLELDALLAARASLNTRLAPEGHKISVNDMVIKAAAVALTRTPEANASYTAAGIAVHDHADIAVAVALPSGLITPIIHAAETKGLAQIAREARDLAARARARQLRPEEYQGGTFSISNLGMFGIRSFSSILNEPHACILSVGAADKRPIVREDKIEIATVMTVTLTCDHRAVDGAIGARFLQVFRAVIEDPVAMIL